MDPRLSVIRKRLRNIERIISVASGKGGVGKSLVASVLALILSKKGYEVGLMDLDFYGPSLHLVLGIKDAYPTEEKGVIPPKIDGLRFMSIIYYTKDKPSPFRGTEVSDALIELLTVTRWNHLDFLIIDMPPGIGEETLDVIRFMQSKFLVVTTPSKVAFGTVKKLIELLKELKIPIIGIVENMKIRPSSFIEEQANTFQLPLLGEIPFDPKLEDSIGNSNGLLKTNFAKNINKITDKIRKEKSFC